MVPLSSARDMDMQVRQVFCDCEWLTATSSLERFDNTVRTRQFTGNGHHVARRSRSTVQHEDD